MKLPLLLLAVAFPVPAPARAEGVRVLGPGGALDFQELQAAVDAATDGDVLIVAAGAYDAFTIDDKALCVVAAPGADVVIQGTIEIRDLAAARAVVLAGLTATGAALHPLSEPGLRLVANVGHVRAQGCTFVGGAGVFEDFDHCYDPGDGGHGVQVTASVRVALVGCTARGGVGGGETGFSFYECEGGVGGDGVHAQGSAVVLYDCDLRGGAGGDNGTYGGAGGAGQRAEGLGLFASGTTIRGGDGGEAWDFIAAYPGDGGDGVVVIGASATLLDSALEGGAAGTSIIPPSVAAEPGEPSSGGGAVVTLAGAARTFQATPVGADAEHLALHVQGLPGDRVHLVRGTAADFAFDPASSGVWLAQRSHLLHALPLGVLPASGELDVLVKTADLAPGLAVELQVLQGFVLDAGGVPFLGSPLHLAVLDRGGSPDCDGNGSLDVLDVLEGATPDCDSDLVPDACQIASGQSPDCNANGVPDACDLGSGASADLNGNGVPDECEGVNRTWHIDANASPDGDGSAASPFQALGDGFAVALPGDTLLVADGLYAGPRNRDLDFAGRDLVVVSENGAAACTIDCQGQGRAFELAGGESLAARIGGFTIRNGVASEGGAIRVWHADATIENCVIEDCHANSGGGILLFSSSARVEGCLLQGNEASPSNNGGGAIAAFYGAPRIDHCFLRDNHSSNTAGALYFSPLEGTAPHLVSHCVFDGNTANSYGGAVYTSNSSDDLVFGNCLFSGNASNRGGALAGLGHVYLLDCTLVDNVASFAGGALHHDFAGTVFVSNCVVWGNAAPSGPAATLLNPGGVLTIGYSAVEAGMAALELGPGAVLDWQAGNLDQDPLFVDRDGADDDPLTTADNDYRLGAGSPCLDAGDDPRIAPDLHDLDHDGFTLEAVPFDLDDAPRQVDDPAVPDTGNGAPPIVDLGAYERQP